MASREKTVYNALPKLPGFNFAELHEPATHGRRQLCQVDAYGTRVVKDAAASTAAAPDSGEGCGIPVRVLLQRFPHWETLDDKVLRFFGYYSEDVVDSAVETARVRKVKIHYYIADGTIAVMETPAVVNSGLPRGTIVSRCREDGVDVFSLCIGASINCHSQVYHLVDCDASTREFYDVLGMTQPEPMNYPYDKFEAAALRPPAPIDELHIQMRRTVEVQAAVLAGTHASLLTPEERAKARDFFEHDRNVLQFYAVWEKRNFRIYYYLADGSLAVLFDKAENDGRDPYPVFVRRRCIPKDTRAVLLQTETLNRPQGPAPDLITPADLRTGGTVDILTRSFFIYDCDAYTRAYMESKGMPMPACARPLTEGDEILVGKRRPRLPKSQAAEGKAGESKKYGASTMVFNDSVAEKDALKLTRYAQDVFRFAARLKQPSVENKGRQFMVCYYLADDTVSVYELPVRNSGHLGGKIFARRPVDGIRDPAQLKVGSAVHLEGVDYVLEEMDLRTQHYREMGMPNMDEMYFSVQETLAKVQQYLHREFSRTTDAFRYYASSSTQGLVAANVVELLVDSGTRPTEEELTAIMARVDTDKDGWVSLADFTEKLMNMQFISDFQPRTTNRTFGDRKTSSTTVVRRGPIQSAIAMAKLDNAKTRGEAVMRQFLTLIEARRTLAIRAFRNVGESTYDGNLGMSDFEGCVMQRLKVPMTEEEVGALLYKFYFTPGLYDWMARRLTVHEIQRVISL